MEEAYRIKNDHPDNSVHRVDCGQAQRGSKEGTLVFRYPHQLYYFVWRWLGCDECHPEIFP